MTENSENSGADRTARLEDDLVAYVQGHLDDVAVRRIEARAEQNEIFAQKLALEQKIAGVIRDPAAVRSLHDSSFDTLRQRIEAPSLWSRARSFLMPVDPAMKWALPSVVVAGLIGAWLMSSGSPDSLNANQFETLSSNDEEIVLDSSRDYARIIFSANLSAENRGRMIEESGFEINGGPGAMQSIVVSRKKTDETFERVLERFCASENITYCQPVVRD